MSDETRTRDSARFEDHEHLAGLVQAFIGMMQAGNMSELEVEYRDLRLALRADANGYAPVAIPPQPMAAREIPAPAAAPIIEDDTHVIAAPMVGTFYAAPAPNEPDFVQVGDRIEEGQTVGIIEAMKIMNEIAADQAGVVVELVARNAETVEYGSPLIRIRPDADKTTMRMRVLTVGEVTAYLKDLIEVDPILADLWVRGEVSNLSRSAAGHMYFCLVSEGIQINCVLFRGNQIGLLAHPRNGEEVLAHGRISIYESRGQYQLMVDNVAPVGMGIMQLQFEEIKRRLAAEGLFTAERKRPLPTIPKVIGVVTSAQGAVWHDIQTVVARRFPLTQLILAPSAVQGPNAPDELIRGLQTLQDDGRAEVIIIGRGGGAAEDLAAFNDERLARVIFGCAIPVVSAVGHETDTCIADLVADVRAATPSAAAELCVPNQDDILATVGHIVARCRAVATDAARRDRNQLVESSAAVRRLSPLERIDRARQDLDLLSTAAQQRVRDSVLTRRRELTTWTATAALLDPRDILRRGYAIVTSVDGADEVRLARANTAAGTGTMRVTFSDGSVQAKVIRETG